MKKTFMSFLGFRQPSTQDSLSPTEGHDIAFNAQSSLAQHSETLSTSSTQGERGDVAANVISSAQHSDTVSTPPNQGEGEGFDANAQHLDTLTISSKEQENEENAKSSAQQSVTLTPGQKRKDYIAQNATKLKVQNGLHIYLLNLTMVGKQVERRKKMEFGNPTDGKQEKIIMVLGATGSGKTTLINGMINYILGVEWDDDFRVKLVADEGAPTSQAKSQTSTITSYTIHHQPWSKVPYTLTIVDTPGFGDTAGIEQDKRITKQIDRFFRTKGGAGLDHISAIGFVAQSSLARLTFTQQYIFDSILSLFGKDIADNIIPLLTFADGQPPQILEALKEGSIPFKKHFKFNSSALFVQNKYGDDEDDDDEDNFDKMFWKMGSKSYQKFLQAVETLPDRSLFLTKVLLSERETLHVQIEGINKSIDSAVSKLNQLDQELDLIKNFESEITRSKNFTYTVTEEKVTMRPVPKGVNTTICVLCKWTCHEFCAFSDNVDKIHCCAMSDGICKVCKGKCSWQEHKNLPHTYEIDMVTVTKTLADLKKRYQIAEGEKLTKEKLVNGLIGDMEKMHQEVISKSVQAKECITKIREIALKPNPLSVVEYVDLMIEGEKSGRKDGYLKRIKQLNAVRKTAKILEKMSEDGYDPYENIAETINKVRARYEAISAKEKRTCIVM